MIERRMAEPPLYRLGMDLGSPPNSALGMRAAVRNMVDTLTRDAKSALEKDAESELTDAEKFALCYFAGVPMKHDLGGDAA